MRKIPSPFLLLGAAALLGGISFLLVLPGSPAPEEEALPAGRGAAPDGSAPPVAELESPAAPAPAAGDAVAAEAGRTELALAPRTPERFGEWGPEEIEVVGRVAIPPGLPADPTLAVLALDRALSPRELYGPGGAATEAGRADRSRVSPALRALAPVAADGSFRVSFPASAPRGWLAVDGRYLCSLECTEIALAPGGAEVVLRPRAGGCIAGRVSLPPGTAEPAAHLARAEASLGPDFSQFSFQGLADGEMIDRTAAVQADGSFEFRAVGTRRPWQAGIECEGFATFRRASLVVEAGRDTLLDARLERGGALRGRVVDEAGNGVAEAEVAVHAPLLWGLPGGPELATGTSDAAGAFALEHVPSGKLLVGAKRPGYLESAPPILELADGMDRDDLLLRLEHGATIAGTVRWADGSPAAGAQVEIRFDPQAMMGPGALNAMRGGEGKAAAGADGRFAVAGLGKGPFQVLARATPARNAGGDSWRAQADGVRPGTADLELVLAPEPHLAGRVIDAKGEPIPAFRVEASAKAVLGFLAESRRAEFQAADGRFVLGGLSPGPWDVTVRAAGHGPSSTAAVDLPRAPEAEELVFVLLPPATVEGVVVGPAGSGVEGATVTIQTAPMQGMARLQGRLELPEARSDEAGAFRLEDLGEGTATLVATHPDYAASAPVSVPAAAGAVVSGVTLALRRGGILTGEVYDRRGEPAAGATVILQDTSLLEPTIATAGAEGTFRLEGLRPGTWSVTAMLSGREKAAGEAAAADDVLASLIGNMLFASAEIADGEETHVVLGAPPAEPIRVHGRVTHAGEPCVEHMLTIVPEGAKGISGMKMTRTDSAGAYEVEIDGPGTALVTVAAVQGDAGAQQNSIEFSRTIPAGDEVRLDLELPVGRIAGTIFGPDGKARAGVRVGLAPEGGIDYGTLWGGQYAETISRDDGSYELVYLRPGVYSVAAGGAVLGGFLGTEAAEGREVRGGLVVEEGASLERIDFHLKEPGDVTGTAVDERAAPVEGVAVFLRDGSGRLLERFSMTATGPDGRFRYASIAPGEYTITARGKGLASIEGERIQVREGESTDVTVTMVGGTMLLVTVIDETGAEVRARLSVADEAGREVHGMLSLAEMMQSQGTFAFSEQRVGPLPPGRYTVTAVAEDGRRMTKPVTLAGAPERHLKVRLH
ncbi:MAG: carboxypeptidase-like regulatory domain-containing protein [Planctomycetota bacterium]